MIARQIAIGFGIAVVFPLLLYYGVSTFSPPPIWGVFHPPAVYTANMSAEDRKALQDRQKTENAAYAQAARTFSFRLLCVEAPFGYAAILLGAFSVRSSLGTGLIFGGIFAVSGGYWWYWTFLEDWVRFVSLLLAMVVLVFVGYRQLPANDDVRSRLLGS